MNAPMFNPDELIAQLTSEIPFVIYNPGAFTRYYGVTPIEASHSIKMTKINSTGDYYQLFICGLFLCSGQRDSHMSTQRSYKLIWDGTTWSCTANTEYDLPASADNAREKDKNVSGIDAAVIASVSAHMNKSVVEA